MSILEPATLWVHVAAGVVAIAAGVGALLTPKGGWHHRRAGRAFVGAMAVVVATSLLLLALAPSSLRVFLALVAVLSGYLAFTGYRVLSRKRKADEAERVDWAGAAAVVVACVGLIGWGGMRVGDGDSFGTVMLVFGVIGLSMGLADVRAFRTPENRQVWAVTHLQRMVAAFIATVSAVSVVNLTPTLGILAWLWPTALGAPLIVYLSDRYS